MVCPEGNVIGARLLQMSRKSDCFCLDDEEFGKKVNFLLSVFIFALKKNLYDFTSKLTSLWRSFKQSVSLIQNRLWTSLVLLRDSELVCQHLI